MAFTGQTESRARKIIVELRKGDYYEVRSRLIEEWGVTRKAWAAYMKIVNKYLERSTARTVERQKQIQRIRLESLYPACFKSDPETGEEKVDIKSALAIMVRQADLDGLDAPVKSQVEATVSTTDVRVQQEALQDQVQRQIELDARAKVYNQEVNDAPAL